MSQTISPAVPTPSTPKVGFVSLGCPKASLYKLLMPEIGFVSFGAFSTVVFE